MTSKAKIEATEQKVRPIYKDAVIVGSGFGGLCMAIQLREHGNDDFVILEKEHEVGGTWRDNSYPGCACDVQSHMYSFSFAPKADWSKRYAPWNEIQAYILDTTRKYGIRDFCDFGQEVTGAHFDSRTATWTVETGSGKIYQCNHFILASGPLHIPQIPNVKGLDKFKGKIFHSARWEHDYDLKGKRVASIGTGGSAIQYCPEIAPDVDQLYVYQRTPAWVIPRDERKYTGLEKLIFEKVPGARQLYRDRLYWSNESRVWPIFNPALARSLSHLAKLSIKFQVKDKRVAEKLIPDYTIGCKRILISNKYYPMFNRGNVELVTDGISEVTENSIVTSDGVEREVDCIILGTGFVVDPRIYMKNFSLTGLEDRDIRDDWANYAESYYGVSTSGYPNFWQLVGPNSGLGHNSIIFMIEAQAHYIIECMKLQKKRGADYMNVKPLVQKRFNDKLQEQLKTTVWGSGCQSWYNQADGRNIALWPKSTWRFWLETLRVKPNDYEFGHATRLNDKQKAPELAAANS